MKKFLLLSFFFLFFGLTAQINLSNGLVAYFPLNGNTDDLSSLQINGTNYNAIPSQTGNRNYYYFNGSNAYIYAGNNDRNITNEISVSVWVKTNSNNLQWIVGHYDHTVDRGFQVVMNNGHVQLRGREGSNSFYILEDPDTINDDNWHHIVGLFDHNHWTLIVDCQIKNYLTTTGYNPSYYVNSQPFSISKYPELNNGYDPLHFSGGIDEVRVYNRILSLCEICEIHRKELFEGDPSIIENSKDDNVNVNIFPNPTKNKVSILYDVNRPVSLNIYDINGKFILNRTFTKSIDIDTTNLARGTYLISIIDKNIKLTKKLIIE